jgi:hypothetical protein
MLRLLVVCLVAGSPACTMVAPGTTSARHPTAAAKAPGFGQSDVPDTLLTSGQGSVDHVDWDDVPDPTLRSSQTQPDAPSR